MSKPPDKGLQVERTALAWIRTCLAFVVLALFTFRYVAHRSLPVALAFAGVIAPMGLLSIWLSWRRYRSSTTRFAMGRPLPGGGLAASVTAVTVLTGVLGLAFVLLER